MDYKLDDLREKIAEKLPFLPKEAVYGMFEAVISMLLSN